MLVPVVFSFCRILATRIIPSSPNIAMATRGSKRKAGDEELVELPEDESLDE